ncbi:MAG: TIGR04283 family arsenosugar biosynthesis glycosyltransferase [Halioglobus sp.]|nr:TIGR04283 family arsenosugar biosynthesis glycosyltransferase [Halioglobus sp.]
MSAAVSFVIPVLNEQAHIAALLRALRQQYPHSELVVVDGGSEDGTAAAARLLCDQLLSGDRGRARQMNLGAQAAARPYLCFLHADSFPSVSAAALDALLAEQPPWGFCRVRLSGTQAIFRVIEWFMNQRSRLTSVATGDQMLFVQRALFVRIGGFADVPLMEDIACCKQLRRLAPPRVIAEPVETSSRRWEQGGVLRTVLRMWLLRLAYFLGVAPDRLWRHYYGR